MVQCPQCLGSIKVSARIFRRDFQCPHCGARLRTAPTYSRVLSVLSLLIAVGVLWVVRNRVDFLLFMIPVWFLVLFLLVRVVPPLVPPRLEGRDSTGVTTLGLEGQGREEYKPERAETNAREEGSGFR
jgi:hypothetical protein